jgi:hypothetical protein
MVERLVLGREPSFAPARIAELVAMPRLGATPPPRGREAVALFVHAAAFAVAAEAALSQAARSASRSAATV